MMNDDDNRMHQKLSKLQLALVNRKKNRMHNNTRPYIS
jgi:hypothetical protein